MNSLKKQFEEGRNYDNGSAKEVENYSDDSSSKEEVLSNCSSRPDTPQPKCGKKTRGRVKINMEFIPNKLRRYTTFSKRKSGIMKKAHELATLTGTQVMLLVASETGHVYTFATRKLQPMLSTERGKQLIQTCLNSPDPVESSSSQNLDEQRMSAQGFEEPELSYVPLEGKDNVMQKTCEFIQVLSGQNGLLPGKMNHQIHNPSLPLSLATRREASTSDNRKSPFPHPNFMQVSRTSSPTSHQTTDLRSQSSSSAHLEDARSSLRNRQSTNPLVATTTTSGFHLDESSGNSLSEEQKIEIVNTYTHLKQSPNFSPLILAGSSSNPLHSHQQKQPTSRDSSPMRKRLKR